MLTDPSLEFEADNPSQKARNVCACVYFLFIEETEHAEFHLARWTGELLSRIWIES